MDLRIHKQLLTSLGINLSDEDQAVLAEHIDSTLNQRVIDEIVDSLDEEQLQELAGLRGASETAMEQWLIANVPDLKDIIEDEINILLGDIAEEADEF